MWQLCIFFSVAVSSQCIQRDAVKDALAEQRLLENIRPILDSYISDRLERNQIVIENLEEKISSMETNLNAGGDKGAVFTRWGRSDCPPDKTTLVYSGYAGGSHFEQSGGAAEYVCMPEEPIWGPSTSDVTTGGYIFGAEYKNDNLFTTNADVPCAVCIGDLHSASLMIPGRTECYPGWTQAYHGDLASGHFSHAAASQYVCVDEDAQAVPVSIPGGSINTESGGKLFYRVQSRCGALPCPPYENGKYLHCVVCMK